MTLQPYDGAMRVFLPDGRECWEKETKQCLGSEMTYSYQYSVAVDNLATDYYGRVIDLKVRAPDGAWNEIVSFLPVSPALVKRLRTVMNRGWSQFANYEAAGGAQQKVMESPDYLRVMADVLAVLQSGVKS